MLQMYMINMEKELLIYQNIKKKMDNIQYLFMTKKEML